LHDHEKLLAFGDAGTNFGAAMERKLAIMGAIVNAVTLESHFRPRLLTKPHLQELLEELFESLIHA